MKNSFLPIIMGTDINAYTMSVSFYKQYKVKPVLVGQIPMVFTKGSTIIKEINYIDSLEDNKVFLNTLDKIYHKFKNKYENILLIGTNDFYVKKIIENKSKLKNRFLFNYIDLDLFNQLYYKKNFYNKCLELGLDIPLTHFHKCEKGRLFEKEIPFPAIVKPNNGVEYYANPFTGMEKVYKVNNIDQLNDVITLITNSGYKDELIIQDYIPGDDTFMWDSVYYGNQHGKGELISFAQVALQEHTKTGVGNYTALVVRENKEMMTKLVDFMESLNYTGFANFDIKYDKRDQKFKVFEVNIRQGRSSFYITQCGKNMAEILVDDLIKNITKDITFLKCKQVFSVVPKGVLRRYVPNQELVEEINGLIKKGKYNNPLFYKEDKGIVRSFILFLKQLNYFRKYKHSDWKS